MTVRQVVPTRHATTPTLQLEPVRAAEPAARSVRTSRARSLRELLVIGGMAIALLAVGGAFSFGVPGSPWPVVASLVTQALFVTAGLAAWWLRPHNRIGLLMLLTGLSMWLANLVDAPYPLLAAVATAAGTLPIAVTLHLLLAYPSGRVQGRMARMLVVVGYLVCTVLQTPLYLLGDGPLAIAPDMPPDVVTVAVWTQAAVGIASLLCASAIVAVRAWRADPLERRQLGPLVWYRILAPLLIGGGAALRVLEPDSAPWAGYVQVLALMGLPLAFLIGLRFGSFARTCEVDELVAQIGRGTPTARDLTVAVAGALGDPSATVVYARDGSADHATYVNETGRTVPAPDPSGQVRVHPVEHNGRVVGAITYRTTLIPDDAFVDVLAGIVAMAIEHQMLNAQQQALVLDLRAQQTALRESRLRLLQAEDIERRRIARDLHDGAQQHIVYLGMTARQLSRRAGDAELARSADAIADGLATLLTEFRELVNGIMPAPLVEAGLAAAVHQLAERMPIATRVRVDRLPDGLPAEAESTAYFVVAEALTNVAKHARADSAEVTVTRDAGRVVATIVDDGIGGADPVTGTGLRRLADRIAALGGRLTVHSEPLTGTSLRAEIPCA